MKRYYIFNDGAGPYIAAVPLRKVFSINSIAGPFASRQEAEDHVLLMTKVDEGQESRRLRSPGYFVLRGVKDDGVELTDDLIRKVMNTDPPLTDDEVAKIKASLAGS